MDFSINRVPNGVYNIKKLLKMKDADGNTPQIYIITCNRCAGKTCGTLIECIEDFFKHYPENNRKMMLLYRTIYELKDAGEAFTDILRIYPDIGTEISTQPHVGGLFYEILLDGISIGYAASISASSVDKIKKYSGVFSEVENVIFDEYQVESGQYLPKEIEKFQSLIASVARGGGKQSRKLRVFLLGNNISVMNPYFISLGIHKKIRSDTKKIRGSGWIADVEINKSAQKATSENTLLTMFTDSRYGAMAINGSYLIDTLTFIEKPKGRSTYEFTILFGNTKLGVRNYFDAGIYYISQKPDPSSKLLITFKEADHNQNTLMLKRASWLVKQMKEAFDMGCMRFDDVKTKNIIFDILSIDIYK